MVTSNLDNSDKLNASFEFKHHKNFKGGVHKANTEKSVHISQKLSPDDCKESFDSSISSSQLHENGVPAKQITKNTIATSNSHAIDQKLAMEQDYKSKKLVHQNSRASSGQRIKDSYSRQASSRFGQLSRKSTFQVSNLSHIPYHLLMLPSEIPLPSQANPTPTGPNGNPMIKMETEDLEFYGEMKNNQRNGKGLWESIKYNQCYFGD